MRQPERFRNRIMEQNSCTYILVKHCSSIIDPPIIVKRAKSLRISVQIMIGLYRGAFFFKGASLMKSDAFAALMRM